ncbi:VWA domain-containing protein [Streptomyces lydicus]|uniref:VWA domain-containing protein n=1 Tax=Streptomyces lydicus TaxID=47763 RepID=UPI0037A80649
MAGYVELLRKKSFADCTEDELHALSAAGAHLPVATRRSRRYRRPRKVILLLDVSGSMAAYSRALLFFTHAGVRARRRWEVFWFATRLTRVTRELAQGTPDEALRRASDEVVDRDGGMRIGESLKRFLDGYGHGGLARGAWVVCT